MATLKPCGTEAAHRRHLRRGEEPCHACFKAHEEYVRNRRKKQKEAAYVKAEKTAEPISLLDSHLENLGIVKAAMARALPREIAALSKRRQELEEAIDVLRGRKMVKAEPKLSLIDDLAERRRKRIQAG